MIFETDAITLSMLNAETGRPLTASVYDVTFDDGTSRVMSMGQLVMAICLARATEMEDVVISLMDDMAETTNWIETLSDVEKKILDKAGDATNEKIDLLSITGSWTITNADGYTATYTNAYELLTTGMGMDITTYTPLADTVISNIETKLDQCNTTSQEQMISLQSATNKRDQSYEMISNVLKSLYTVMTGIVNNT